MRRIAHVLTLLIALSVAAAAEQKKAVVFLGDSITAGYGLDEQQSYPALIQEKIAAANLPLEVVNAGVSGDTTAGGLRRLDWILQRPIDLIVIALGGNDGLRGIAPATTAANLQAMIDKIRQASPATKIVLAGMRMPPNIGADYVAAFADVFPTVAEKNHVLLIPFLLEGVGGHPDLNQADQIHPTAAGQKIIAEAVWEKLKPLLLSARS